MLDVVLLINIQTNFSKNIHKSFKLESFLFVMLVSLLSKAIVKTERTWIRELELLAYVNMIMFYEKGIKGWITSFLWSHRSEW